MIKKAPRASAFKINFPPKSQKDKPRRGTESHGEEGREGQFSPKTPCYSVFAKGKHTLCGLSSFFGFSERTLLKTPVSWPGGTPMSWEFFP
jgi:hypothetical protein